jgi:hypothetical protein
MNKKALGEELKIEISKGFNIVRISQWAFQLYSENLNFLNSEICDILETLFSMEDDLQFELTKEQLEDLADRLILEGERDDLQQPDPGIKEKAQELEDSWVMCPLCQEAWRDNSRYAMLLCPKCKKNCIIQKSPSRKIIFEHCYPYP